jgi:hypothetical protein
VVSYILILFLVFWVISILFSMMFILIYILSDNRWFLFSAHSCQQLLFFFCLKKLINQSNKQTKMPFLEVWGHISSWF